MRTSSESRDAARRHASPIPAPPTNHHSAGEPSICRYGMVALGIALIYTVSVMKATRDSSYASAGARGKDWAKPGLFGDWPELVRPAIF